MAETAISTSLEQSSQALLSYVRRLPVGLWINAVKVAALVWLCYSLASVVWVVAPLPSLGEPPVLAVPGDVGRTTGSTKRVDLLAMQAKKLFGDAVAVPIEDQASSVVVAPDADEDAQKTSLNLTLTGILAVSEAAESSAVISQGSSQKIYQIGDKLPAGNNVTLAKILSDKVILDNNGTFESLWLYTESDFKVDYGYTPAEMNKGRVVDAKRDMNSPVIESRIKASDIPRSISDVVRFSVHREDGQMVGFRIRPGKNKELFESVGLMANDVVTSVNGIPINTADAIRNNYQQLKNATTADLEIRRGEETLYINVSLDTSE